MIQIQSDLHFFRGGGRSLFPLLHTALLYLKTGSLGVVALYAYSMMPHFAFLVFFYTITDPDPAGSSLKGRGVLSPVASYWKSSSSSVCIITYVFYTKTDPDSAGSSSRGVLSPPLHTPLLLEVRKSSSSSVCIMMPHSAFRPTFLPYNFFLRGGGPRSRSLSLSCIRPCYWKPGSSSICMLHNNYDAAIYIPI